MADALLDALLVDETEGPVQLLEGELLVLVPGKFHAAHDYILVTRLAGDAKLDAGLDGSRLETARVVYERLAGVFGASTGRKGARNSVLEGLNNRCFWKSRSERANVSRGAGKSPDRGREGFRSCWRPRVAGARQRSNDARYSLPQPF